jgi:dTDP-4-dehydrorhamnose 3,5-epimerase
VKFEATPIDDLLVVRPLRRPDARGFFSETWSQPDWRAQGLDIAWCQDNHSLSHEAGVLRGLHYQAPPMAQAKLVRCTRGRIWDVAVDARRGAPCFGKWFGIELSAENWAQLYVPRGFLHGFLTLEPNTEVQYKVDNPYAPECDGAVRWDDPELAIDWPLVVGPVLSEKDAAAPGFTAWDSPFGPGGQG